MNYTDCDNHYGDEAPRTLTRMASTPLSEKGGVFYKMWVGASHKDDKMTEQLPSNEINAQALVMTKSSALREQLAALEHARWARWQAYLHSKCQINQDGSLTIPADLVERWEHQIATPYAMLSEREKDSDRRQVDEYLPLVKQVYAVPPQVMVLLDLLDCAEIAWEGGLTQALQEASRKVESMRDNLCDAGELLAIVHRDGGHYLNEHGWRKACEDAIKAVLQLRAEISNWKDFTGCERPQEVWSLVDPYDHGYALQYHNIRSFMSASKTADGKSLGWGDYGSPFPTLTRLLTAAGCTFPVNSLKDAEDGHRENTVKMLHRVHQAAVKLQQEGKVQPEEFPSRFYTLWMELTKAEAT